MISLAAYLIPSVYFNKNTSKVSSQIIRPVKEMACDA